MGLFSLGKKAKEPGEAPPHLPEPGNDPRYAPPTQVEMMEHADIPVFLSGMHAEHPPRWVSVFEDRVESVVGLESDEYMDDASNHTVWAVSHFIEEFPFVVGFLNVARPGQTARFADQSGTFVIEDN